MNESFVQRKIIETHTKRGWLCVKLIQTTINGIPDLMMLKNGRAVFVECKRPGIKTAAPLQQYRIKQLRDLGFDVHLTDDPAFSVNEIKEVKKIQEVPELVDEYYEPVAQKDIVEEAIAFLKATPKTPKMAATRKRKRND